jgi:hypothetical protein
VDRVAEQRHRSGEDDDEELDDRRCEQRAEGDHHGVDAATGSLKGGVDRVGGVVGPEDLPHGSDQPAAVLVITMGVIVSVGVGVVVAGLVGVVVSVVGVMVDVLDGGRGRPAEVVAGTWVVVWVVHAERVCRRWWRPPVTAWSAWRSASLARRSMCSLRAA